MNGDVLAGAALVAVALVWLAAWGLGELRQRWQTESADTTNETAEYVDDLGFTLISDHPVTPEDLQAIDRLLTNLYGPVTAAIMMRTVIAAVAMSEAEDIDVGHKQLGGAA